MMTTEHHRPSSKLIRAPLPPKGIPINPNSTNMIKDLRYVNLLNEFYPFENNKTHVQETVEIIPQPVSCERIFYSYIDNHTDIRSREDIQLNQGISIHSNDDMMKFFQNIDDDSRLNLDFYSTTLYIFPKQRNEKFISEIRYIPEHITIRYKTTLELLSATLSPSSPEHYYQNIDDFYHIVKDIFYRI
jgi:hypothetical protein